MLNTANCVSLCVFVLQFAFWREFIVNFLSNPSHHRLLVSSGLPSQITIMFFGHYSWFYYKGGGKCVCPRWSVCLLARLLKNACTDLDEMLRVNRCWDMDELINFWARSDYSLDAGTGLLSLLSYKCWYAEFYVRKIGRIRIGQCSDAFYGWLLQRSVVLQWFHSLRQWAVETPFSEVHALQQVPF